MNMVESADSRRESRHGTRRWSHSEQSLSQPTSVRDAHVQIRSLAKLVTVVITAVPATSQSNSPRQKERDALRSTSGGGGRTRARLLDELSAEGHLLTSNLLLVADGVADFFELASQRDDVVNWPVLTIIVRPVLEIAGQIAWLLDETIEGDERADASFSGASQIYELDDCCYANFDFRRPGGTGRGRCARAGATRGLCLSKVGQRFNEGRAQRCNRSCGIAGRRRQARKEAVAHRDGSSRVINTELYNMLSIAAHGARLGTMFGLDVSEMDDRKGRRTVQMGGFGLDPNLAIGLTARALSDSGRRIGGWNGLDTVGVTRPQPHC